MAFSDLVFERGKTTITADMLNDLCAELKEIHNNAWRKMYPVGSILISTSATSPSTYLGGTWELFAQGRTLIGVGTGKDVNDVSKTFNAGATGGSYSIANHGHSINSHGHSATVAEAGAHTHKVGAENLNCAAGSKHKGVGNDTVSSSSAGSHKHSVTVGGSGTLNTNKYGNGTSGNIQPYVAVYIFKRKA